MVDDVDERCAAALVKAARDVLALGPAGTTMLTPNTVSKRTAHQQYVRDQKEAKLRRTVVAYTNSRLSDTDGRQRLKFEHGPAVYSMSSAVINGTLVRRAWRMNGLECESGRAVTMKLKLGFVGNDAYKLAQRVFEPTRAFVVLRPVVLHSDEEVRRRRFVPRREMIDEIIATRPALRVLGHRESRWAALPCEIKRQIMTLLLGRGLRGRDHLIQFPRAV